MLPLSPLQKFGEWLPDRPPYEAGGASVIKNAIPVGQDYVPFREPSVATNGLGAPCRGAISMKASDGIVYTFAGTDTGLWLRNGLAWTDVSKAGGYTGTFASRWRFVQYGNYVICTNGVNTPQYYLIGTSTDFADVTGAPICKFLSVINNFIVASGIVADPSLIEWSALDNPLDWTASAATQSDSQSFYEVGQTTAVTGGQNSGVVIGTTGIGLMEYVGPPFIFTFRLVEPNMGSRHAGSVISYSNGVFYLAEDGFKFFNGAASLPIGYDKVDNWFIQNADLSNISSMSTAFDGRTNTIAWGVPSSDANICSKVLIYSPSAQRFSYVETSAQQIMPVLTESVNVDDLTTTNVDDVEIFSDDPFFAGGQITFGGFDGSGRLVSFSGASLEATVETQELQLNPDGRAFVGGMALFGSYVNATVSIRHRNTQTGADAITSVANFQANGEAYLNLDARYMRAVVTSTDFSRLGGIKVRFKASGQL
jgi:hypothetical protein